MLCYIEDISGRVEKYDEALFYEIASVASEDSVKLKLPGTGLISLVPRKFKNSANILKRLLKVFEGLLNYSYTIAKEDIICGFVKSANY